MLLGIDPLLLAAIAVGLVLLVVLYRRMRAIKQRRVLLARLDRLVQRR